MAHRIGRDDSRATARLRDKPRSRLSPGAQNEPRNDFQTDWRPMSRAMFVALDEDSVRARCLKENVGISAIERIPTGGVRLVCMSNDGAERMRGKFKSQMLG